VVTSEPTHKNGLRSGKDRVTILTTQFNISLQPKSTAKDVTASTLDLKVMGMVPEQEL